MATITIQLEETDTGMYIFTTGMDGELQDETNRGVAARLRENVECFATLSGCVNPNVVIMGYTASLLANHGILSVEEYMTRMVEFALGSFLTNAYAGYESYKGRLVHPRVDTQEIFEAIRKTYNLPTYNDWVKAGKPKAENTGVVNGYYGFPVQEPPIPDEFIDYFNGLFNKPGKDEDNK